RHHPVDREQEQHRQEGQEQEARQVAPAGASGAPPRLDAQAVLDPAAGTAGGDRRGAVREPARAHARPLPRSRTVSRNWNAVTTSSRSTTVRDIAAAELNWKRVNASSVMNIITLCVVRTGPPFVITCGCPKSWNEAIVVVTAANSVTGFSCGQVM